MKRGAKMLILLALLIALAGGYVLVNRMNRRDEAAEESGSFPLAEGELTALHWERDGETYDFEKFNDTWADADDASFPVDQDALDGMAERLTTLEADRRLADVADAADYGIGEDSFSITAGWSDGSSTTYAQGDATPFDDGWYLRSSADEGCVYVTDASLDAMFAETRLDLAEQEELPEVEEPERLNVGGRLTAVRDGGDGFEPNQRWYEEATGEPLDDIAVDELASTLGELEWQSLVSVDASEEELAAWGLDDASALSVSLSNADAERALLLGLDDETGARFARLPGSSMVYTVSAEGTQALVEASAESLWRPELAALEYDDVQSFEFELDGQTLKFPAEEEAKAADAGVEPKAGDSEVADGAEAEAATDAEVSDAADGVEVADDADAAEGADAGDAASDAEAEPDPAEALWQRVSGLTATARAEGEPGDLLLTLRVTGESGVERIFTFWECDVDSYIADDGLRRLLVPAADVDALIRALRQQLR